MNNPKITVRAATREDAQTIARVVAMAIGDESALLNYCGEEYLAVLTAVAASDSTQYAWSRALVAEVNGIVAGGIVGYDGAQLRELREGTFSIIRKQIGRIPTIADETEAGEYYLDSLAIFPEFRGIGAAHALIEEFCHQAFTNGHHRVGLIVDQENPEAERLYSSLGFMRVGIRTFLGHTMWHLQRCR